MFKKVLIANRGEIAVRIAQTLQEMGLCAVAVYSDPDRHALHVERADEAYGLEGTTSGETYLKIERLIAIARQHGVDAIHPGYGFLSENAQFAEACAAAGITFIGPKPDVIRAMGDKIVAKKTMQDAGVPVVPGWSGAKVDVETIHKEAGKIGYPVLVKAAAGGGGKGMRVVEQESALAEALEAAQREANAAFGDARVFLEKYITHARHVEVQIFGDTHGNAVHLFERECSIQRRHQKIIEESPSPALTPDLRAEMGAAAVRAAKALGYTSAGTVEFMLDANGKFYFLEVNTRLQVEHPVTELVTRHDLVRAQLAVAAGEPLPFSQESLAQVGHAQECRIYAEDAARGFLPSTGTIVQYAEPSGPGIRVDSGVRQGSTISVHYDPMLAKLVVWGPSRAAAIEKMVWALDHYCVLGVTTNIEFLRNVLTHEAFGRGETYTRFLSDHQIEPRRREAVDDAAWIAAAFAAQQLGPHAGRTGTGRVHVPAERDGPWQQAGAWRAY